MIVMVIVGYDHDGFVAGLQIRQKLLVKDSLESRILVSGPLIETRPWLSALPSERHQSVDQFGDNLGVAVPIMRMGTRADTEFKAGFRFVKGDVFRNQVR
jgi:hypothetical protein